MINNISANPEELKQKGISEVVFFFLILLFSFFVSQARAQQVEVIKYPQLDQIIRDETDHIQVINMWATWCKPCIKELPYFEALHNEYGSKGVKVTLVSFDFVEDLDNKVIPFVKKRKMTSEVKLLDETDYNAFIDKIDSSWSGAIPATLIINNKTGERKFYEKEFSREELFSIIETQLN